MPPEKSIVEFQQMIDPVADPGDMWPVPPTVLNVGVQGQTPVEVLVDGDPDMLVLPKDLAGVEPMEVDIAVLNQQAPQDLRVVGPAENQPLDEYWETGDFTWKIENWSQINRPHIISEDFVIGGYKWRLLLSLSADRYIPDDLSLSTDRYFPDDLSLFLDAADSAELPLGWSRFASFSLAVVNQSDPKLTAKKRETHLFNQDSKNSGFGILSMLDLWDPSGGFLVNDSLIIQTEVNMRKVADYLPYDSKKETGFVGLKNQGATCYLNSLIQSLYHLPCFRKAMYHMPTSRNGLLSESIPLALQTLFYNIQCANTSPGTEDLTKSFGWDTSQSFRQEDVHEFNLFLCEKLEKEMKGTPVDGTIQELFEGHFISYIECIDVVYKSDRTESFYDLQLDVKGCKDVYGSFDKYVEVDKLEGENQYRTHRFGLQDARKGAKFIDLPPVLQLQLKRFQHDSNQDRMVKINDRYEFPLQLDLDRENGKYISPDASQSVRNLYTLHSVLVHSGASIDAGHYYAFVRPTLSDQWYKFNDDLVTKEEPKTVFEEHFGGEVEAVQQHTVEFNPEFTNSPSKFTKYSNAYMLVYVRECDREKVMCSVDQEDVPEYLQVRLQEEGEEEPERKTMNRNAHRDTWAAEMPPEKSIVEFLPMIDTDADPGDMWRVPPTVLNVGVQGQTKVEVAVDGYPDILVLLKDFVGVGAMDVDIAALDQQAAEVLRIVGPAENRPFDEYWETGDFTWKIENWSEINRPHIISENFVIGGYKWRLLLSLSADRYFADDLSLFLGVADSGELPLGWSRFASFSLAVVNQSDPKLTVNKGRMHHFNQDSNNSGFVILSMLELYDPSGGFLVDDSLIVQTEVNVRKVADYLPYDSKKETGFVGLKNQGATCYLNSLIQSLYHLPCFRKAMYHMPTSRNGLLSESIPLALQTLFYNIQCANTSPGTEDLTKSFGWDTSQSFRQEDVHEFNLFLCEKLEKEMKGTPVDGTIQELFEGHFISYIECIDVVYKSDRTESFYDLQLDVKGCKDVYGSFDKYVEVDKLEGENQYRTHRFGLQDARKGAKFIDLPPVLQLQLKRFQHDSNQDRMVKINDRYEFPLQLDLDRENGKYISPDASQSVRNLYTLHSVLVHSGASIDAGHYYAFVRPTLSDQWYKFNDDLVTKEEPKTVFEEHFGGEVEAVQQHTVEFNPEFTNSPSKFTKYSNAYMLVYVRECDREKVMCSVDQEDVPEYLQVRLQEEGEEEPERKTMNRNAHRDTWAAEMPPEKSIVEFLPMIDTDADPGDMWRVPPTVLNVGVQGQTKVEVAVDGYPDILVLLKDFVGVGAMDVDIAALDQQAAEVLRIVGPAENRPFDEYWETGDFTWKIENWSEINRPHIISENFVIGGYKWRLLLSLSADRYFADDLSLFLGVADSGELPLGWSRFASFSLAVVNQSDPKLTVNKGRMHHFNQDSNNSGFVILSMLELYDPSGGFLVDDSLIVQTEVNVRKVADYLPYDSKKETGFVGLKNQGATCYLNSLIQSLYHLPCFRKAMYHMPTSRNGLLSESIPLALQTLFYNIQCANTSPGTEDLTKSFGWDTSQSFRQEDVHEFNLFLCEKLEKEMKGTPVDGTIQELFEGHFISYIECIDVVYKSDRTESFYDLQLDVKGCKDVYGSFDKYVEVDKLEGENQYRTHRFGLQDARKGAKFIDLPPVLQLQLKRFQHDSNQDRMVKINDRYEFPLQLDLDRENGKYISPDASQSVRNLYTLHSVLVHSGASIDAGHYYAFVRPTLSDQWYKFNDDLVTKEEPKTVFEEHFGGEVEAVQQHTVEFNPEFTNSPSKFTKYSNAYMLVYVRECDREKVMCSVDQEDVPEYLQVRLQEEGEEEPERKTMNRNAHRDTWAAEMPPEKSIVEFLPMIDTDADPGDMWRVPPTVLNVGVQGQTKVEVAVDGYPDILVLLKDFVGVGAMDVDIAALDQQAAEVLRIVGPAENRPFDEYWETGDFTWKIENWSEINRPHIISENFVIGGYKWRLLLSLSADRYFADDLSLFLGVADSGELPLGWSRFASFSLAVVNQSDPKLTVNKGRMHHFNQDSNNSGFVILSMLELYDPSGGFLVDDSLIVQTEVNVRKVADYLPYDSKKETGFVGLKNQGATCYLNSLIQSLYHLPCFRKAVYHMPTSRNDLLSESIPLALQTLFYNIQCADTSPGTDGLTKSFGWDTSQSFRQEDVHEFNRFLCEKLEKEMRGTPVDGTIQELFEGHFISYIECIDVVYKSDRTESFYDLQLDVKGCKDVYGSFDKYVEVDKLEGENQYRTHRFGLQDARKGAKFIDLPPVLQLQLKRFQRDSNQGRMVKINDRYEFPLQLDLDRENGKYMSPEAGQRVRNLYTLHSVLVHSGASIDGGHYYAFIRPTLSDQWYKFNDDLVTKEEPKTVFEEHFGGEAEAVQQHTVEFNPEFTNSPSKFTKYSNAYMLVYVRECDREKVMCSVDQEDVPDHFQVRLKEEEEPERKTKNRSAHRVAVIRVSLDEDFEKQIGKDIHFELVDHDKVRTFRIRKKAFFSRFRDIVAEVLCIPFDRQRFWLWSERDNVGTYRVARPLSEEEKSLQVFRLKEEAQAFNGYGEVLNLFLEVLLPGLDPGVQDTASEFLLFLKLYIPERMELIYKGKIFVKATEKPIDILEKLNWKAGFEPHQEVQLYEEVGFHPRVMCDHIDKERTFEASGLESGDIICFQKTLTREEAERCCYPDVRSYFEYVHNRQFVNIRLLDYPDDDCFRLELSKQHTYAEIAERVAEKIGEEDPFKIRLSCHNGEEQKPMALPIKYRVAGCLSDMLVRCKQKPSDDIILYFKVDS